jgi:long-chain fatty acid transport protein
VDFAQVIAAPTLSFKINERHSLGIAPLLAYQRFEAYGLQAFDTAATTVAPGHVTNRGYDSSFGYGVRVGWMGKLTDYFTVGAAYATKLYMGRLDDYKGLFAEHGNLDGPENYSAGFAMKLLPNLTLALDYQRINYGGVKAIGDSSTKSTLLGSSDGPGFNWQDTDVGKIGLQYQYNDALILRAGYSHASDVVKNTDITFNILAPGVFNTHYTLGASYVFRDRSELSFSYMHAPEGKLSGPSTLFPGTETLKHYQDSAGLTWTKKF